MRIQLALNVQDLERAVAYYSKLFGVAPQKRKLGYANFATQNKVWSVDPGRSVLGVVPDPGGRLSGGA